MPSTLTQKSIFDFQSAQAVRRTMMRDKWEDDGLMGVYLTDAKSFIASIGKLPDGKALTDTRLRSNHFHGSVAQHYFNSAEGCNEERPFESFLQCMGHVHKEIGSKDDVVDILSLTEYDPVTHRHDYDYRLIESAWIDGGMLHIDTDGGDGYDMVIREDSLCDPYRVEEYEPDTKTEHMCIEALRHGASPEDVGTLIHSNYAHALYCYKPFVRDFDTGRMVHSKVFDTMLELARVAGIVPQISYDVPKPRPETWDILPVYKKNYCQNTKGCKKKRDMGCSCCEKFLYNWEPVQAAHLDDHKRFSKRPKRGSCESEEDEEE